MQNVLRKLVLLACGIAFGIPHSAGLANSEHPQGMWSGFIAVQSLPQQVKIAIATETLVIDYPAPRSCRLTAKFKAKSGKTFHFNTVESSCPHSARAAPQISVQRWGDVVEYELSQKASELPLEVGYLSRR